MPFWECFARLSRRRPVGMAPGAIPLGEVREWLDFYGIEGMEARERYLEMVDALDAEYLRLSAERFEKAT